MANVTVNGQTYVVDPNSDESMMNQLKDQGVEIVAACNGAGICQTCAVKVNSGTLSPKTDTEEMMDLPEGQRLSCQCHPESDEVEIELVY